MATHQITVEELTGLILDLTDVVKDRITRSKLNLGATDKQIHNLTKAVSDLTNASPAVSATERPQPLRLPQVNLPSFTGEPKHDLKRFFTAINNFIDFFWCAISALCYVYETTNTERCKGLRCRKSG